MPVYSNENIPKPAPPPAANNRDRNISSMFLSFQRRVKRDNLRVVLEHVAPAYLKRGFVMATTTVEISVTNKSVVGVL